ncbi:hypothetical protein CASFOL_014867 [Castilleja foliolosa]|uniref:Uncharacterized protein n=1 Tax=Castilleja foliolosa TaxID=1961234 RepID=A0ABD3DDI6_9LAMI
MELRVNYPEWTSGIRRTRFLMTSGFCGVGKRVEKRR